MGWWEEVQNGFANLVTGGQYGKDVQALQQGWGQAKPKAPAPSFGAPSIVAPKTAADVDARGTQQAMLTYGTPATTNGGRSVPMPAADSASNKVAAGIAAGAYVAPAAVNASLPLLQQGAGWAIQNPGTAASLAAAVPFAADALDGGGDSSGAMSDYDAKRIALAERQQAARDAAIGRIQGLQNPYDTNSDTFKKALALTLNNQTRNFAGGEARIQGDLAARGMLGSGQEAAALGGFNARRAQALSDAENGMYADALTGNADFALRKELAILGGLGGPNLDQAYADLEKARRDEEAQNQAALIALIQGVAGVGGRAAAGGYA